jgi:membrane protease subunit HflK
MGWNEPGGPDKQKQPPDLDEALKRLQQKFSNFFKSTSSKPASGGGGSGSSLPAGASAISFGLIFGILALIWALSGIYIVAPAEEAVVLRFGSYLETQGPGLHWIPRFIDTKSVENVKNVSSYTYTEEMLNKDEIIVSVSVAVQYRIDNLRDYLYNVVNPQESLQQATASALRSVIGHTTLDEVLTVGREQVRSSVMEELTHILSIYHAGLVVTDVNILPAKAPEQVKTAFDDAIKAQVDEQRYIYEATAYAAKVKPDAEGVAQRLIQEAQAYKQKVTLDAEGRVASYLALLPQYLHSPAVTRERMYLDAISNVLADVPKVIVDVPNGSNMLYLPLDKLMEQRKTAVNSADASTSADLLPLAPLAPQPLSESGGQSSSDSNQGQGDTP